MAKFKVYRVLLLNFIVSKSIHKKYSYLLILPKRIHYYYTKWSEASPTEQREASSSTSVREWCSACALTNKESWR